MSMFGDSWKGGSARAAVRSYVTKRGKKVKAHTRKTVRRQAKIAGHELLGNTIMRAVTGKGGNFWSRLADSILLQLTSSNKKSKTRRKRR